MESGESGPKEKKRIVRRSTRERARLIRACWRSGRSQREFAKRHGINYTTLLGWLRRDRQASVGDGGTSEKRRFAEVTVKAEPSGSSSTRGRYCRQAGGGQAGPWQGGIVEVVMPGGVVLRTNLEEPVQKIAELVKALAQEGC